MKRNLIVITLAFLPNEAAINFASTGSAACTSKHMHIDTHRRSCIDEQWQQKKKKKKKKLQLILNPSLFDSSGAGLIYTS